MKKILLITGLFILSALQVDGQDYKRDSIRYAVAYEYIQNDSIMVNRNVILSDEHTGTIFRFYSDELEPYLKKPNESTYDYRKKLFMVDHNNNKSNDIKDAIPETLYFSKIIDCFLFAEYVYIGEYSGYVPSKWREYMYLFIFDVDNTIIREVFRLDI